MTDDDRLATTTVEWSEGHPEFVSRDPGSGTEYRTEVPDFVRGGVTLCLELSILELGVGEHGPYRHYRPSLQLLRFGYGWYSTVSISGLPRHEVLIIADGTVARRQFDEIYILPESPEEAPWFVRSLEGIELNEDRQPTEESMLETFGADVTDGRQTGLGVIQHTKAHRRGDPPDIPERLSLFVSIPGELFDSLESLVGRHHLVTLELVFPRVRGLDTGLAPDHGVAQLILVEDETVPCRVLSVNAMIGQSEDVVDEELARIRRTHDRG